MRDVRGFLVTAAAFGAALVATPTASGEAPAVERALRAGDAPAAQLDATSTRTLSSGAVVSRFAQEVGGVPIQGAGAVVVDRIDAPPELIFDKTDPGIAAPGDPGLSRSGATGIARRAAGVERLRGEATARLVVAPGGDGTLAWEVLLPAAAPLGDFLVTIHAASGARLSKHNLIRYETGQARLFVPNAVVENDGYDGIADNQDANSNKLTNLRTQVDLENIEDGQTCLKGDWARVRKGDDEKQVCKSSLDWSNIKRRTSKFEALMAYHHVDQAQEYIQSLGLLPINAESQNLIANPTLPPYLGQDNSFYSPGRDEIWLGRGGVDDGEDADVIVHEYGHAVQDAQNHDAYLGLVGNQAGAQGEGFGDYLAAAYSSERVGFDSEWTPCIMEWDATAYDDNLEPGICLRRADVSETWSEQKDFCGGFTFPNEIHCIGEVWASALLDLRTTLDDDPGDDSIGDTIVLVAHEMTPPNPTFAEASQALIEADESEYDGIHCLAIEAELESREFFSGNPCP